MQPLLTTWTDIETKLLKPALQHQRQRNQVPAEDARPDAAVVAALRASPLYRSTPRSADAVLYTLQYLFHAQRCGVYVSVRDGAVTFHPFANAEYTNTWHTRLVLHDDEGAELDFETYRRYRCERAMLAPQRWWLNGSTVCNLLPPGGALWGDAHFQLLFDAISAAARSGTCGAADFFVNKRDFPQLLEHSGAEPPCFLPMFSFYGGPGAADICMPTPDDYTAEDAAVFAPLAAKEQRAVWRGSATGAGITPRTNARLRLAQLAQSRADLLDAGVVSYNSSRDKITHSDDAGRWHVARATARSCAVPCVPRMTYREQFERYAFVVYVDGHCAAARYGTLMHSGSVILRVASTQALGSALWAQEGTCGACIPADGDNAARLSAADHLNIDDRLTNLEPTIAFLRAHGDVAQTIANNARQRAPTREKIAAFWRGALTAVSQFTAPAYAAAGKAWFSPFEPAYAGIAL